MSLDLGALAERFKRAGQPAENPAPDGASPYVRTSARAEHSAEAPWLTAEAAMPPVTTLGPTVESNTPADAPHPEHVRPLPPPRASGRAPSGDGLTMPDSAAERDAEPVDQPPTLYPCPFCRQIHQPVPLTGGGMADAYSRTLTSDPYSPRHPSRRPRGPCGPASGSSSAVTAAAV
jgi:hypothetical protein